MSLDMQGFVDDVFVSTPATRISRSGGGYVDGIWVEGTATNSPHNVNLQPLTMDEIDMLNVGGERVVDVRKIYVNDGDMYNITEADLWQFTGVNGTFKSIKLDNRSWQGGNSRNYCKVIVSRIDNA